MRDSGTGTVEGYNQDSGTRTVGGYNEGLWDRDSWRLQSLTQGQGQLEVTIRTQGQIQGRLQPGTV